MAAGDAALLAAAVKAAIQAKASRRTTAAIAAAVASALASAAASAEATAALGKPAGATRPSAPPPDGFSVEELGERQRASRRARRKRQRERKRRAEVTATSRDVAPEGQAMEVEPAAPPPAAARELQPQALKREHHAQLEDEVSSLEVSRTGLGASQDDEVSSLEDASERNNVPHICVSKADEALELEQRAEHFLQELKELADAAQAKRELMASVAGPLVAGEVAIEELDSMFQTLDEYAAECKEAHEACIGLMTVNKIVLLEFQVSEEQRRELRAVAKRVTDSIRQAMQLVTETHHCKDVIVSRSVAMRLRARPDHVTRAAASEALKSRAAEGMEYAARGSMAVAKSDANCPDRSATCIGRWTSRGKTIDIHPNAEGRLVIEMGPETPTLLLVASSDNPVVWPRQWTTVRFGEEEKKDPLHIIEFPAVNSDRLYIKRPIGFGSVEFTRAGEDGKTNDKTACVAPWHRPINQEQSLKEPEAAAPVATPDTSVGSDASVRSL